MSEGLRRLIVEFKKEGPELRVLYRSQGASGPSTKARRREVEQLARDGLERALEALKEGPVECIGTSGFQVREDVLGLPLASSSSEKPMKRGA